MFVCLFVCLFMIHHHGIWKSSINANVLTMQPNAQTDTNW